MNRIRLSSKLLPLALLALAACAMPSHGETQDALRAPIAQVRTVITACRAAKAGCDPRLVPADGVLHTEAARTVAVRWNWLRSTLDDVREDDDDDRVAAMDQASAHVDALTRELAEPPPVPPADLDRARAIAAEVLSRPEFNKAQRPGLWDRFLAWLSMVLARLFTAIESAGHGLPWLGLLLEVLLFVGAAGIVVYLLYRSFERQRVAMDLHNAAAPHNAWAREADDWAAEAQRFAAAGQWRDALHCLYWASIILLESRRLWSHNPARTPREYVRLLPPSSPLQTNLRNLTRLFERTWYGLRDASSDNFTEARTLYDALAANSSTPTEAR